MQPNIVFLDEYSLGDADLGSIRALGNYTGYRTTAREEVADRCREADVVITNKVVFRRETLRQLPRLRLICVAATGMNHIDLEAAAELGIAVKNAVGYSTHAVTETTIGAAIGLLRQTVYYDRYVKTEYAGSPLQYHFGRTTHQLYGSKWGIVGLGNIGRSVARVAEALGCRIAYTSTSGVVREEPYPEKPLDELLRWADVVSVHAPLNDRTRNLIGARELALMKPSAILINVARGGIVDEAALAAALDAGRLAGAGLDVFTHEPLEAGNPLLSVREPDRLLLSPHNAWSPVEAIEILVECIARNIRDFYTPQNQQPMSQPEPNLTVVIPVHNAAPHLGACVESLLAQSYTDFELILVENGSSDDSRERCARYAAEHPGRIRTLTLDEASVSAARNAGIDNARGRFITFMDADDWAEKEFLAEFFRDPAPGPGTIVMQGILLDFSEAEPPGPNEAFFSYDDGALAIGDDPSAAVGQRFLQDGCSVCKLYHTETLRRLGIRFIEHLCSREDHLFFFTCISRMQSVVWRSGLYMHYMRRGRNTLSTRPMPACELVEAAERLDRFIPQLAERFGITDKTYLFALRQNLVRDTLLRAANNIRFGDRRSVLGAIAARPELFGAETYTPRWHPLLKRPLLDRILKGRECRTLLYLRIALRRSSLRLRGRFNA